jgi:hypothetical protein
MTCEAQLKLQAGRDAWSRIRRNEAFPDWLIVGEAVEIGQAESMRSAKTNVPRGRRYCAEMAAFLKEHGLHEIDNGARSRLLEVMRHRFEIEAWHRELPIDKRVKLNHPQAVLSAWKRHTADPTEKPKSVPNPELVGIWKSATAEDRRAALDASGLELLLEALSPALRTEIEQQLSNPHTVNRLAEKDAKEKQTVEAAKKETDKRAPKLGRITAYNESKRVKRSKTKTAAPKNIGQWRKFPREKLQAVYDQERQRMETEHLNVREQKRLEEMRERLAAFDKTETAAAARNGNGGDPAETAKARMAENPKRFAEESVVAA